MNFPWIFPWISVIFVPGRPAEISDPKVISPSTAQVLRCRRRSRTCPGRHFPPGVAKNTKKKNWVFHPDLMKKTGFSLDFDGNSWDIPGFSTQISRFDGKSWENYGGSC